MSVVTAANALRGASANHGTVLAALAGSCIVSAGLSLLQNARGAVTGKQNKRDEHERLARRDEPEQDGRGQRMDLRMKQLVNRLAR